MNPVLSIAPYVTVSKYAEITGESVHAIRGQLDAGYIPEYRHKNALAKSKGSGRGVTRYVDITKITIERLRASGSSILIQ